MPIEWKVVVQFEIHRNGAGIRPASISPDSKIVSYDFRLAWRTTITMSKNGPGGGKAKTPSFITQWTRRS